MKNTITNTITVEGIVTVTKMRPQSERDMALRADILSGEERLKTASRDERKSIREHLHNLIELLKESCMTEQYVTHNLVVTSGLTAITKGMTTNLASLDEIEVNYTSVGSGTTAPVAGNTTLGTEVARKAVTSLNYSTGTAYIGQFWDYTEANGTHYEGGTFINATATANSGTLFNRVLLESPTGITKTSADLLTINYQITFTAV
jgi:hypothetical protein